MLTIKKESRSLQSLGLAVMIAALACLPWTSTGLAGSRPPDGSRSQTGGSIPPPDTGEACIEASPPHPAPFFSDRKCSRHSDLSPGRLPRCPVHGWILFNEGSEAAPNWKCGNACSGQTIDGAPDSTCEPGETPAPRGVPGVPYKSHAVSPEAANDPGLRERQFKNAVDAFVASCTDRDCLTAKLKELTDKMSQACPVAQAARPRRITNAPCAELMVHFKPILDDIFKGKRDTLASGSKRCRVPPCTRVESGSPTVDMYQHHGCAWTYDKDSTHRCPNGVTTGSDPCDGATSGTKQCKYQECHELEGNKGRFMRHTHSAGWTYSASATRSCPANATATQDKTPCEGSESAGKTRLEECDAQVRGLIDGHSAYQAPDKFAWRGATLYRFRFCTRHAGSGLLSGALLGVSLRPKGRCEAGGFSPASHGGDGDKTTWVNGREYCPRHAQ